MEKQTVHNNNLLYGLAGVLIFLLGVGVTYVFMNVRQVRGFGNRDSMQNTKQLMQEKRGRMMEGKVGEFRKGRTGMDGQRGAGQGCRMQERAAQDNTQSEGCTCGRHAVEVTE